MFRGAPPGGGTREGRGVGASPAVEQVDSAGGVRARVERVVTRAARNRVGGGVAGQAVVEPRAEQVLETAERVGARAGILRPALSAEAVPPDYREVAAQNGFDFSGALLNRSDAATVLYQASQYRNP